MSNAKGPRILVVANQKGGVGKTTTAINLGTALAAVGQPTLVVDIDPQGNASTGPRNPAAERKITTYDVLMGEAKIADAVTPTKIPGLSLVPSTVDLSGAELELIDRPRRNNHPQGSAGRVRGQGAGPVFLCADRLSALAHTSDRQCDGGGRCRGRAAAMRVFRAGGPFPIAQDDRACARQSQSRRWRFRASC